MRRILLVLACLGALAAASLAQNVVASLIAPLEPAAPGGEVRVDLVILNTTATEITFETPLTLEARLTRGQRGWPVVLRGQAGGGALIAAHGFSYRSFVFTVPPEARGRLALELDRPLPARAVVDVRTGAAPAETDDEGRPIVSAPLSNVMPDQPAATAVQRTFAGRFSAHEAVYFIYGPDAPAAKFQFSFKYRLFGDAAELRERVPALRGLHLGFTQRSLWDVRANSSPFYDTSYMPELMFESQSVVKPGEGGGMQFLGYQVALKHESNGKGGADSRSLNTVQFRTAVAFGRLDDWNLLVMPRVFAYLGGLDGNADIGDYRGHGDLVLVVGRNDGTALSLTGRPGRTPGHGALQADLTFPLKSRRAFDFATYLLIQYWTGYGESLLDYNRKTQTFRAGFSLVR